MIPKPTSCVGCPLAPLNGGFSRPDGSGHNQIMFIGEALGEKEKVFGFPFVPSGEAGSTLHAALRLLKVDR